MASPRVHYIDWLRVLAVLLLFPFHVSRVFNAGEPFYVKSPYLSEWLGWALGFIDKWHMPLLFLLAGASTFFALGKRSSTQYVTERVKRLLVPLLFGFFVLIPPQTWYGGQFNSGYRKSFATYLTSGEFLRWNVQESGDYFGGFGIGHLWFILFLLILSLIALPLLRWWRTDRGRASCDRWARRLANPAWWLVPAIVLWLTEGIFDIAGKSPLYYLTWFLLGYVIVHDETFAESAERLRWVSLAIGSAICAGYVLTGDWRNTLPDPSWALTGVNIAGMLGAWMVVVALIGLGRRLLDRPSPTLAYLAEASYPIYIIHQTAIVVAAYYVVRMGGGGAVQWLFLFLAAVASTFALYEVVRRVSVLRFLFGMRPKKRPAEGA